MSATGDILRAAKKRIRSPERWAKGAFATVRGTTALISSVLDPDACLCADGALLSCAVLGRLPPGASLCLTLAARVRGFETASKFNDAPGTKHGDVMALFDDAAWLADGASER